MKNKNRENIFKFNATNTQNQANNAGVIPKRLFGILKAKPGQ
jgi:hypothetical protein